MRKMALREKGIRKMILIKSEKGDFRREGKIEWRICDWVFESSKGI